MARRAKHDDEGLFASAPRGPFTARVAAGIDEAGLGPLLGPFTLGWCAFRAAEPRTLEDLWAALAPAVSRSATALDALAVCDSKEVWTGTPRGALRLERVVRAFERLRGFDDPRDAREWFRRAGGERFDEELAAEHWWEHAPPGLCGETGADERAERERLAASLAERARANDVGLAALGARAVTPVELNRSFARTGSKSRSVWEEVRAVLRILWRDHAHEGLHVVVDRQGGRARYAPLLAEAFPGAAVAIVREAPADSVYRVDDDEGRSALLRFVEKAESLSLPVALASCRAKYARELAMEAFNRAWSRVAPDVAPTAGYVEDGRRWLAEMADAIDGSGVPRERLVRSR